MKQFFIIPFILLTLSSTIAKAECLSLYNHQLKTLQGEPFDLCEYQDKPILVVNTASKCGFTPQFQSLESLYKEYGAKGLLVVGFPSNDFRQELSSNHAIGDFCKLTYNVDFPMIAKSNVTGANANLFYQQLAKQTGQAPMWNFYKYLILPNAEHVYVYSSDVRPYDDVLLGRIKGALTE